MDPSDRRASFDSASFHSRFQSSITGNPYFPSSDFYPDGARIQQSEPSSYGTEDLKSNYWIRLPSERQSESISSSEREGKRKSGTTGTFSYFSPSSPRLRRYDQVWNNRLGAHFAPLCYVFKISTFFYRCGLSFLVALLVGGGHFCQLDQKCRKFHEMHRSTFKIFPCL